MTRRAARLLAVTACALALGLGAPAGTGGQAPPPGASLTLDQLVGQRLVLSYEGTQPPDELVRRIGRGEAAGVILFTRNIRSRSQLRSTLARLQAIERPEGLRAPLLVMIDQEGGLVKRLDGPPRRSPAEVGRSGSARLARREGVATARSLRRVGVNANLAPVVDVGRPGSSVRELGRSYGGRPGEVSKLAVAFARGLADGGVLACAKHFPGLGAGKADEDRRINRIGLPLRTLREVDEAPFAAATAAGVPLVMVSTGLYPALDSRPAMFSRPIATDELRGRIGFQGVSITDDLEVPAARRLGSPGELALRSAEAGNDLLLYAQSQGAGEQGARALAGALQDGRLPRSEAEAATARVLALRATLAGR